MTEPHFCRVALTGTPGTGKSAVSRELKTRYGKDLPGLKVQEVSALALQKRLGRRVARGNSRAVVEVDMERLSRLLLLEPEEGTPSLLVGHLSHLLPVDAILLLRCRPDVLQGRLQRRRGTLAERLENVETERIDLILWESLQTGKPVFEHDTSREKVQDTARWVRRVLLGQKAPIHGIVNWLREDPPVGRGGLA